MPPTPTTSPDLLALDAENRSLAIDPGASFIIEAPAGAGKTELLTQRYLALLATVGDPEEIIALTFTNKAAAEMRTRIFESLALAGGQRPGDDKPHRQITFDLGKRVLAVDAERQWGLLLQPGRLQITTLDALCGRLARQMPLLSRFGSQPAISSDNELHYRQAARNTLDMLEEEGGTGEIISRVLEYFDNDGSRLQSLLESMLASRDQWLGHAYGHDDHTDIRTAQEALGALVAEELAIIARALPPSLQAGIMPAVRYAAVQARLAHERGELPENLKPLLTLDKWTEPLRGELAELAQWRGLLEMMLTADGEIRARHPNGLGFGEKDAKPLAQSLKSCLDALRDDGVAAALARIRKLPCPRYDEEEWRLIGDLVTLLRIAAGQLWLVFKEERQVDFTQVAQNALQALGTDQAPTDLQLQLDYRISHLLVDEFQDTSPTQVAILERLTAGWQPNDGRTLFLVGDPMQSIYRFRKADVGLFLRVRERGIGQLPLRALQLHRNNRSHAEIVDWVNRTFPSVFLGGDNQRQGSVRFSPAAATKGSHPGAAVRIHPIIAQGQDELENEAASLDPAEQRQAERIIALIRQARQEDPAASIAVLVRARSHLDALVTELRRVGRDLPYQAVEIEALSDRQAIQDLAALTRALHHRADRVNWLAILRAPWCGLLLEDLHKLAADDHERTIWQLLQDERRIGTLSPDGQQRLTHVRAVLSEAFRHQGRQRPRRWVEGVWQCLGGPSCLSGEGEALDVRAYFKLLDALEERGQLDVARLGAEMDKLFAAPDPAAGASAIQIMTIHKSKGLEFDVVILPGLHKASPADGKNLLVWDEVLMDDGEERMLVAPIPSGKVGHDAAPGKYEYLREFEKIRSDNEGQRVLYVAATRAIRQLHLLGIAKPDARAEGGTLKAPGKGCLLSLLWGAVRAEFEAAAQAQKQREGSGRDVVAGIDGASFVPKLIRLIHPALPEALNVRTAIAEAEEDESGRADDAAGSIEADIGTLVHRYLELIASDGLDAWPAPRVDGLTGRFVQWFVQRGHGQDDSARAAAEVRHDLITALNSETGRWILGPHESAGCEVPITSSDDGTMRAHVVDRTFVADGVRWIIDYKTTRHNGDDLERFLNERMEAYREQLERYRTLFASDPLEVRAAVYFVGHDRRCELRLPSARR